MLGVVQSNILDIFLEMVRLNEEGLGPATITQDKGRAGFRCEKQESPRHLVRGTEIMLVGRVLTPQGFAATCSVWRRVKALRGSLLMSASKLSSV